MPLVGAAMKAKFKKTIEAGLAKNFPNEPKESWGQLADAISDIAMDIVEEITTNAEVSPGISVATTGGPAAQSGATIAPGKIK